MHPTQAENPDLLASFEGLIIATQRKFEGLKRYEPEEVRQILRTRVWRALLAWDPDEPRTRRRLQSGANERELLEGFVYGCVANQMKDLLKRDRRPELLFEDFYEGGEQIGARGFDVSAREEERKRNRFEGRYLAVDEEEVFGAVEETEPLVPNTLTSDERLVLACFYLGYNGPATALKLNMSRQKVRGCVRSIREKMRDWRPVSAENAEEAPAPNRGTAPAPQSC